jgi:hypothetical protein
LEEDLAMSWLDRLRPVLRGLPDAVYAHLVTSWGEGEEALARYRCMTRPGRVGQHHVRFVRVIDPDEVDRRGLKLREYGDLDGHPQLIRYEGWFADGLGAHLTPATPRATPNAPATTE